MKSLKMLMWLFPLMLGLGACGSDDENDDAPQVNVQLVTGDIQEVSLTSATLQGTVNASASNYTEVGIAYRLENSNETMKYAKASNLGSGITSQRFSVSLSGLQPDATYSYCTYGKTANGKISNAKEKKTFHTESPTWLLKYNTMQWVAITDATLSWSLPNDEVRSVLTDPKLNASFGVAWSTDKDQLAPVGSQFNASTQSLSFNQGMKATAKLTSLTPSTTYYYTTYVNLGGKMYVSLVNSFVTLSENYIKGSEPADIQAVDLGLPSGTKWANVNIGAEKAEENGLFFAWAETVGFSPVLTQEGGATIELFDHSFDWIEYKYCYDSQDSQRKYCTTSTYGTVDNKVVLDLSDDAAYINWGDKWRMPTSEDVEELFDNTTSMWTSQNGVYGCMFTSMSTGKSIFLPAAGCGPSWNHYDEGVRGYYWSSSVDKDSPYASRYLGFMEARVYPAILPRYYGMTIRPVAR